jgi:hypothetical protein
MVSLVLNKGSMAKNRNCLDEITIQSLITK